MDDRSTRRLQGPVLFLVRSRERPSLRWVFTHNAKGTPPALSPLYRHDTSAHEWLGPRSQRKFKAAENRSQMFGDLVQCLRESITRAVKAGGGLTPRALPRGHPEQVNTNISAINTRTPARFLQRYHNPLLAFPAYRRVIQTTQMLCGRLQV